MSHTVSMIELINDAERPKTPNFKVVASSSAQGRDGKPMHMDDYGKTPNHFYEARKPPPSFVQAGSSTNRCRTRRKKGKVSNVVKKKLNLQTNKGPDKVEPVKRRAPVRQQRKSVIRKPRAKVDPEKRHNVTGIGQLAKKFLKLMSDATDGILNLNNVSSLLSVPKRRLYDITNVLEGVGLVQKISKNTFQYTGKISTDNNVKCIKREIDVLEAKENQLDELIDLVQSEISAIKLSEDKNYLYVTSDDIKNIIDISKNIVVGVNIAPTGQFIETFPDKLVLANRTTEIDAYLLAFNHFENLIDSNQFLVNGNYHVTIVKNAFCGLPEEADEVAARPDEYDYAPMKFPGKAIMHQTKWGEGDTVIKNAFIEEDDDIAPMGNFLMETEDQDLDSLAFDNHSFTLDDGEGIIDLFDCQFPCP